MSVFQVLDTQEALDQIINYSIKQTKMWNLTLIALLSFICQAWSQVACDVNHDIELIYGGYNLINHVLNFVYDIDLVTYDIVGAVDVLRDPTRPDLTPFVFFINQEDCIVSWQYEIQALISISSIHIDRSENKIVGLAAKIADEPRFLFKIGPDIRGLSPQTLNLYRLDSTGGQLIVPTSIKSLKYFILTENSVFVQDKAMSRISTRLINTDNAFNLCMFLSPAGMLHQLKSEWGTNPVIWKHSSDLGENSLMSVLNLSSVMTTEAAYLSIFENASDGIDQIGLCLTGNEIDQKGKKSLLIEIFAVKTQNDNTIVSEQKISSSSWYGCDGINVGSDGQVWSVIREDSSRETVLSLVNLASDSSTYTVQQQAGSLKSWSRDMPRLQPLLFIDQVNYPSDFFYGGQYVIGQSPIALVYSMFERRRSQGSTLYESLVSNSISAQESPNVSYETLTSDIQDKLDFLNYHISPYNGTEALTDDFQYISQQYSSDLAGPEFNDIVEKKSVLHNTKPLADHLQEFNIPIYTKMGNRIDRLLPFFIDYDYPEFIIEPEYKSNRNLQLYTVLDKETFRYRLYSNILVEGQNADLDTGTTIEIRIRDSLTKNTQTYQLPLYILNAPTYHRFESKGIISHAEESILSNTNSLFTASKPEPQERGGSGGKSSSEYESGLDQESGFSEKKGSHGSRSKDKGSKDSDSSSSSSSSSSDSSQSGQQIIEENCYQEVYYEENEGGDAFVAYKSKDDLLRQFMRGYDTVENYKRVYGGEVTANGSMDANGKFVLNFSRPIVYPKELIADFNDTYVERVPELVPTDEEMQAIESEFEEMEETLANGVDSGLVAKTRTICEEIVIDVINSGDSTSTGDTSSDKDDYDDLWEDQSESDGAKDDSSEVSESSDRGKGGKLRRMLAAEQDSDARFIRSFDEALSMIDRITIELQDLDGQDDEDDILEELSYTWQITSIDDRKIELQFEFSKPELISSEGSTQVIAVKMAFSDFEPGWNDDLVITNIEIPKQDIPKTVEEIQQREQVSTIAESTEAVTLTVIAVNVASSGAMNQVWSMINGMQIYSHLPLFKVSFPTFSSETITKIITVSSFQVLPTGDLLTETLQPPENDGDELIERFEQITYESYFMIMNLDALFVIFVLTLTLPLLIYSCLAPCKGRSEFARKKVSSLTDDMHGNLLSRYLLEGCLDIGICYGIEYHYINKQGLDIEMSTTFKIVNTSAQILLGSAIVIFPFAILAWYLCKFHQWSDEQFEHRYGATLEGLRKDQRASVIYPVLFITRRVMFAFVAIIAFDYLFVQFFSLLAMSTIVVVYLTEYRPFEESKMLYLECFNEVTTLSMIYIMISLCEANHSIEETRIWYDIAFVVAIGINILVHLSLLARESFISVKEKIKASTCCCCCKTKAIKKEASSSQAKSHQILSPKIDDKDDAPSRKIVLLKPKPLLNVKATSLLPEIQEDQEDENEEEEEKEDMEQRDSMVAKPQDGSISQPADVDVDVQVESRSQQKASMDVLHQWDKIYKEIEQMPSKKQEASKLDISNSNASEAEPSEQKLNSFQEADSIYIAPLNISQSDKGGASDSKQRQEKNVNDPQIEQLLNEFDMILAGEIPITQRDNNDEIKEKNKDLL